MTKELLLLKHYVDNYYFDGPHRNVKYPCSDMVLIDFLRLLDPNEEVVKIRLVHQHSTDSYIIFSAAANCDELENWGSFKVKEHEQIIYKRNRSFDINKVKNLLDETEKLMKKLNIPIK